jgi:vitamin K-dependent gamma-carboxylase
MRLRERLGAPVDAAGLAAFRALFGLLGFVSVARVLALGWHRSLYLAPAHTLSYAGFGWVPRPGATGLYALFAAMLLSSLGVALGLWYRASALVFFVAFTWVELLDASVYLNHYYFISLLALLLSFLPLGASYSVDARGAGRLTLPAWCLLTLRAQVGLVYFFAGVAKLGSDWLLRAQPLRIWLSARADLPVLGPLLGHPWTPWVMSWAGAAFDLSVPFLLAKRRTRPYAYAAVLVFHTATGWLFPIGMFPVIMSCAALVFFDPSWPRARVLGRSAEATDLTAPQAISRTTALALGLWFTVQALLPLRHHLLTRDVNWTQHHARFSWRVMLVERAGFVEFDVVHPTDGRRWRVSPSRYLQPHQVHEMSMQADLIAQTARIIADDFARRGIAPVRVYADSHVAMNGHPSHRYVDPSVDLAHHDGEAPVLPRAP